MRGAHPWSMNALLLNLEVELDGRISARGT
jgi:hypothetical protein